MKKFDPSTMVRANIRRLKPYSSARSEFAGAGEIFLDANENALGSPAGAGANRYPDPLQTELKGHIAVLHDVDPGRIFVGNGSDEAIDLLFRIFCEPGRDSCIVCPPTYGMYRVCADINDVRVTEVPLGGKFQLDVPAILGAITQGTKLIFICSPNNPTGNLMRRRDILAIADAFSGLVVVDEAYAHFAGSRSLAAELKRVPNLVVLQTFSKAWGMAGLRVGLAFAGESVIELMNRVKPPYNLSSIAQSSAQKALALRPQIDEWVATIRDERTRLANELDRLSCVEKVFPSEANFLLIRTRDAGAIYGFLISQGIVVRDRSGEYGCEGCLRVTIGTREENDRLIDALKAYRGG